MKKLISATLPYMILKYLSLVLKMSGLDKKTKDLMKQAVTKTEPFLTFCINHTPISPTKITIRVLLWSATNPAALPNKT